MRQECRIRLFCVGILLTLGGEAFAQPALPDNYRQMKLYELDRACDALEPQGFTAAQRADAFVEWMSANDWQSDELNDQYNLFDWVRASTVDATHFSARWTGLLTPPVTGAYTLRQLPVYGGLNSKLKVYVGEQLVLDSSGAPENPEQFTSQPIQLSANQAVPLRVELVHEVNQITTFGESAPMCVLTWKTQEHGEVLIPSSALLPPEGFGNGGHGLKGEYFGGTKFENLRGTRLDATLGFDWWWQPVIATHEPEAQAVLNACKSKLLSGEYLSSAASEGKSFVYNYDMRLIAHRLSAAERLQLVNLLNGKGTCWPRCRSKE